jgi:redox-sensitive bicupin YhaK (pirin superfamily)
MTISSVAWIVAAESVFLPPVRDLNDGFKIRRALPSAQRRIVGPFIFLHHFEPIMFGAGAGPNADPHPHIGLSTVCCLPEGAIIHRDSAGNPETICAGDANWMTGGRGIVSSGRPSAEVQAQGGSMFGQQISVALSTAREEKQAGLSHHVESSLFGLEARGVSLTVVAGEAFGEGSPVPAYSDPMYVEVVLREVAPCWSARTHRARRVRGVRRDRNREPDRDVPRSPAFGLQTRRGDRVDLARWRPRHANRWRAYPRVSAHLLSSSKDRIEQAKDDWRHSRFATLAGETEFMPPLSDRLRHSAHSFLRSERVCVFLRSQSRVRDH